MRFWIFFFLFFYNNASSQPIRDTSQLRQLLEKAVILQKAFKPKKALSIISPIEDDAIQSYGENKKGLAKFYYNIASCHLDLAQYEAAKSYLDKTLSIYELSDSISLPLANTYMLFGIYYDYMADYDRALAYYKKTEYMYQQLLEPDDQRFGYLFNNIGICIFFQGDVQRALGFFNKTVAITVESSGTKSTKVSRDLTNASLCHTKLNETDHALKNLALSLEIVELNQVLDSYVGARIYHALSLTHFELGNYQQALQYGDQAHRLRIKHFHPKHIEVAKGYFSQADIYLQLGDYSKAEFYLNKAKNIYQQLFEDYHPEIAYIYFKLSSIALKNNELLLALEQINNSLRLFEYDEHVALDKSDQFDHQILAAIELKAKIHLNLWQTNKNILHLKKSNKIYGDLITLFNLFRQGFKEDISKELLAEKYFHIFESALEVSYELAKITDDPTFNEQAFNRAEYSTSYVLLENIRNNSAKENAGIPDSLLFLERQLRQNIAQLKQDLKYSEDSPNQKQATIVKKRAQLFDAKEKHTQLITTLESGYHNYHYYKQDLSTISLEELRNNLLSPDQSLVEYFVGEKFIFVFVITKEDFILEKVEKDFPLQSWISGLQRRINQYQYPFNLDANYHNELVDYASKLHAVLIQPIEKHLRKRLIIIPGGPLAEIPFECLIKKAASNPAHYKKHQYLVKDYAISYCYSATLLKEMINSRSSDAKKKAVAFAPDFNNFNGSGNLRDITFLPLKHNVEEVSSIGNIIDTETFYGHQATESEFLSQSDKYSIIHFATHAQANNDNSEFSFLAFSEVQDDIENELLFVKDIYNLPLRADMVTLSACETGIGENKKGEGIISLARSFAYAGTGNINTSLWKVNDQVMADLMKGYYQNIANKMDKDNALQLAKLQLIDRQESQVNSHPYYWTAMITIGDINALDLNQQTSFWLWLTAGFFIVLFSIWTIQKWLNTVKS
jgi:CHAT domain-containing protein